MSIKARIQRLERLERSVGYDEGRAVVLYPEEVYTWQWQSAYQDNGDGSYSDPRTGEAFYPQWIVRVEWSDSVNPVNYPNEFDHHPDD